MGDFLYYVAENAGYDLVRTKALGRCIQIFVRKRDSRLILCYVCESFACSSKAEYLLRLIPFT